MITSGLVLTLSADRCLAQSAEAALRARPECTLAGRVERWLPVAIEVADVSASRDLHEWLHALPGVEFVDVVQVNFDEEMPISPPKPRADAGLDAGALPDCDFSIPTANARGEP